MKKLFLFVVPFLFISCVKTVYVDSSTGNTVTPPSYTDFFDYERASVITDVSNMGSISIIHDKRTDVLYIRNVERNSYQFGINLTPIMKADGTCLTYSEWRNENGM